MVGQDWLLQTLSDVLNRHDNSHEAQLQASASSTVNWNVAQQKAQQE